MKYNRLLKSGCGLLLIAGALTPLSSLGSDTTLLYGEGTMNDSLQQIQASLGTTPTERGAQGPIRTEGMANASSAYDGSLYDDLKKIQSTMSMDTDQPFGARGPIRTEGMANASSAYDGSLYDDLKKNPVDNEHGH